MMSPKQHNPYNFQCSHATSSMPGKNPMFHVTSFVPVTLPNEVRLLIIIGHNYQQRPTKNTVASLDAETCVVCVRFLFWYAVAAGCRLLVKHGGCLGFYGVKVSGAEVFS